MPFNSPLGNFTFGRPVIGQVHRAIPLGVQAISPPPPDALPKPLYSEPPLTTHERVKGVQQVIIGGAVGAFPKPPASGASGFQTAASSASSLLYNTVGATVAEGHLKANPLALALWFAAPVPFGTQDPRVYGLSRDYQLGNIPLRPALIFDEVSTHVREDLLHGHSAAVAAAEQELADQARLRAEFRNRISGLSTDQLLGLATTTVLPVEYRGLQFFRGEQQALLDVLAERGFVRGPGNTLIPPKPAGPGELPTVNPKDP